MAEKKKGASVCTWLNEHYVKKLDDMVATGEYNSRSELIREAVRLWFRQREERFLMIRRKVGEEGSDE